MALNCPSAKKGSLAFAAGRTSMNFVVNTLELEKPL